MSRLSARQDSAMLLAACLSRIVRRFLVLLLLATGAAVAADATDGPPCVRIDADDVGGAVTGPSGP